MNSEFTKIGVISKGINTDLEHIMGGLLNKLTDSGYEISFAITPGHATPNGYESKDIEKIADASDLLVIVGGDGTLLKAAKTAVKYQKPIVGINKGRLGFLVDVSPDNLENDLYAILRGEYFAEPRLLLKVSISTRGQKIAEGLALNEVVLHASQAVRMVEFETHINKQFVHRQRGDGMIVCTPTGSTAYSLSCGGPIIQPGLGAISLIPISPHTLSNRPIVVSDQSIIEMSLAAENRTSAMLAVDGQAIADIDESSLITIERHEQSLMMLHPKEYDYYHILREKLHWSELP